MKRADYNSNQSLEWTAYRPGWASMSGEHNGKGKMYEKKSGFVD